MSNPLRNRVAKAALLLAASAAPVVAAAGQASAAGPLLDPNVNGLDAPQLLSLDEQSVNEAAETLDGAATPVLEELAGPVVEAAMPMVMPVVHDLAVSAAQDAGPLLQEAALTVTGEPPTTQEILDGVPTVDDRMNDISLL
ncbi:ATP-binding protein [Streptomyces sp. 8K308]|uniref:ATP-binding protein n=1 Tax=Streptomyces sp. 8K308 TaxID=2530388 RepID=UPI001FB64981|nr:ATP-binding protein [Streptomyces sp. 8K308]